MKLCLTAKKALIIQSLFFYPLFSQTVRISEPAKGAPLQETQDFLVDVFDGNPTRVEFFLNGRLIFARKQPPFHFQVRWNTNYKNRVKVVAFFDEGDPVRVERDFEEIKVDVRQSVEVFQFFPFLEKPEDYGRYRLRANGQDVEPQRFEPATKFPLNLVIALDVSGSMKYFLRDLDAPIREFLQFGREQGFNLKFITFDQRPGLIDPDDLPDSFLRFYRARQNSVVWDAVATACDLFQGGPRRVILLISDGGDRGSKHTAITAFDYLRNTKSVLLWLSPAELRVKPLQQMVRVSGGFPLPGMAENPWEKLKNHLANQYYLLAPNASFPIEFRVSKGKIWYPRWEP